MVGSWCFSCVFLALACFSKRCGAVRLPNRWFFMRTFFPPPISPSRIWNHVIQQSTQLIPTQSLHSEALKEPEIAICRMVQMKHRLKHIESLRDSKCNTFKPVERSLSFCRWSNLGLPCCLTTLGQQRRRQGQFERGHCLHE